MTRPQAAPALLPIEEVAQRLGVAVATLRYWRHNQEGPPMFKLGKRLYTTEEDLAAWVQAARSQEAVR